MTDAAWGFGPGIRAYLEEVAVLAGADGEQRDHIVETLARELSADIAAREQAGGARGAAESDALLALGSAEDQARRLRPRAQWLVPVLFFLGMLPLFYLILRMGSGMLAQRLSPIAYMILTWVASGIITALIFRTHSVTIEPDGLRRKARRRSDRFVAFDSIHKIDVERFSFGARPVRITDAAGSGIAISRRMFNFRRAVAVLEARVSADKFTPAARRYLDRAASRPERMGPTGRAVFVAIYIIAGILILWDFPLQWNNLGVGIPFAIGAGLLFMGPALQQELSRGRLRRGVMAAVAALGIYTLLSLVWLYLYWSDMRGHMISALLVAILAIIMTLWRIRSVRALAVFVLTYVVAGYAVVMLFPRPHKAPGEYLASVGSIAMDKTWITPADPGGTPTLMLMGADSNRERNVPHETIASFVSGGDVIDHNLGKGNWRVMDLDGPGRVLLANTRASGPHDDDLVQYYSLHRDGDMATDIATTGTMTVLPMLMPAGGVVSPSGKYILAMGTGAASLVMLDRETSSVLPLTDITAQDVIRWKDDSTLELAIREPVAQSEQPTGNLTLAELDAATGRITETGRLHIGHGMRIFRVADNDLALVHDSDGFGLCKLDGTTSATLPPPGENRRVTFHYATGHVAYLGNVDGQDSIIYAGPGGVEASHPIGPTDEYPIIDISPDGKRVFLYRTRKYPAALAFGRLLIWDLDSNTITDINGDPLMLSVLRGLEGLGTPTTRHQTHWTPDSQGILWPMTTLSANPPGVFTEVYRIAP